MRDVQHLEAPVATATPVEFRQVMGRFATGVGVVSVPTSSGGIAAMTINSLVSVSLEPMLVSWNLQRSSSQFEVYSQADQFAVSILNDGQSDLAKRYAARGDSQLSSVDFATSPNGLPVIDDALGVIECRRWSQFVAGDHLIILGEVIGLSMQDKSEGARAPLAFFDGEFCSIG